MIHIEIPQRGALELHHAVFDVNGTLAIDGRPFPEAVERLQALAAHLTIHLLTAGTHGNLEEIEKAFGLPLTIIQTADEKTAYVQRLNPSTVIAFGNGANDAPMLRLAAIGVAVVTREGLATSALQAADVLALHPADAIDLLLKPKRLIATLRG